MDAKEVKKIALESGADLVGIAPMERFKDLEPEGNPLFIKPNTKSVVILGFQVLRGSLRGIETGSSWGTLHQGWPCVTEYTYNFCRILESAGYEAVPLIKQSLKLRKQGVKVSLDKPEPDVIVDMDYLAYAAGMGQFGQGKFFLTPEYGPRQYFTAVLTDLALEGDPLFKGEVCDGCGECLKACPARAYDANEWTGEKTPCGDLKWRPLHIESCEVCKTGITGHPYSNGIGGEPNRLGAACGRACVAHLEASGRLKKALRNPFREAAAN